MVFLQEVSHYASIIGIIYSTVHAEVGSFYCMNFLQNNQYLIWLEILCFGGGKGLMVQWVNHMRMVP